MFRRALLYRVRADTYSPRNKNRTRAGGMAAQPARPAQPGFLPCPVVPRCGQFAHLASGAAVG
jgi:hypothetical protein